MSSSTGAFKNAVGTSNCASSWSHLAARDSANTEGFVLSRVREGLEEVHSLLLAEALRREARLVLHHGAVLVQLQLEDLLARQHVGPGRQLVTPHERPHLLLGAGAHLLIQRRLPLRRVRTGHGLAVGLRRLRFQGGDACGHSAHHRGGLWALFRQLQLAQRAHRHVHLRLVIGLVVVDLRRGLQAFGASLPSLPGVHGREVADGRLGLPAVLVRAVASPVHLELKAAVASALAHDALHDVLFFRSRSCRHLGVAARRGGLVLLPPLSRHAIWLAVVLGAQLHLRHLRQRVAHTVIAARKRVHEGEAAAAVRHVARGDHLPRAQREHVRRVLRVVVAQIDARLRLGLQPAALLLRHVAVGVAAPHVDVPQAGLLAAHRLVRRHPRVLRDVRAVPHERRVASRPAPQLWRRARVLDHGALVILERAHGALGGPIQLLGACRRPAQLLPVLGAERLQRLVDELRAAVRVQALDRAAELRLRLANKDGDVVRDLVLAPQLGVPHVAGEHVLHHQAVLHDHAAIALHLHLVRVHVHALARLGAAVQAAVPKGCPRRLALDARRALTNARLCRLDAAAAHALQVNAVVEHPAAVQHAHHARPAAMGHLLVQAHQRVRVRVADRPGGPRVSKHHALRSGAHQHRHSAARAERHAVPSGRHDVRFLRGAVVLPAQLLGQKLAAQQVRREALVVQHVVDDDAHHLAAVRHHAERHAPDVAGMDDAAVRHLDRHRSALAQRDESSAVAAAAGRRHAVPAPGIIGQCCIQRHCLRLGLRAGALGIGGHRHLLRRGTLRANAGGAAADLAADTARVEGGAEQDPTAPTAALLRGSARGVDAAAAARPFSRTGVASAGAAPPLPHPGPSSRGALCWLASLRFTTSA